MRNKKSGCNKKLLVICLSGSVLTVLFLVILFNLLVVIDPPQVKEISYSKQDRIQLDTTIFALGNNWLKRNNDGLWELYIEGGPYERGLVNGILTSELIKLQEAAFVDQIKTMIPNSFYLYFLKVLVAWFNRNLDEFIQLEYQKEIFGISKSASDEFNYIASGYQRILNYHAAHDIGHALADMSLVGCTSFSAWDEATSDSSLIIGRNFDFYVGDEFAKEKIVAFINPSEGYKFMMVTWAGMIGVVSGMNEYGLTVTLNAAKSDYPTSAATPISLVAREILQYAKNIGEAYSIANKRKTFVAESIMIGSKFDNKTVIIEKSPEQIGLFQTDSNYIICSNHYQSDILINSPLNQQNIKESSSLYRYKRVEELLNEKSKLNINSTAGILRNKKGLKGQDIGLGNEKSINQLLAHHSVIFNPTKLLVWVSTNPYQLGNYIAYDLNKIFNNPHEKNLHKDIRTNSLTIPSDNFLLSAEYTSYIAFLKMKKLLLKIISESKEETISHDQINDFIKSNPEQYQVYSLLGDYFVYKDDEKEAIKYYDIALMKEIATLREKNEIKLKRIRLLENE